MNGSIEPATMNGSAGSATMNGSAGSATMNGFSRSTKPKRSIHIRELNSPCLLLDRERLDKNISSMNRICKDFNLSLRPNTKTHKTVEIAVLATGGTRRCIEVSTPLEAEIYADAGFDDILYAYPITQDKIDRCIKLMSRLSQFHVQVSDLSGLECLKKNQDRLPEGKTWSVALDMDLGMGRTGFLPDSKEFVTAYRDIIKTMRLLSLYSFCGHAYNMPSRTARLEKEHQTVQILTRCKEQILREFPDSKFVIALGSTPTCNQPLEIHRSLGEFHPGSYVFYDYEQYLLNNCRQSDIAIRIMTRVVSHKEEKNMILVDCGTSALGHKGVIDRPQDFCIIEGESNLRMVGISQELGKIKAKEGELDCKRYPVGTILFIIPFQANATVGIHHTYYVHTGEIVHEEWKSIKGW